MRSSNSEFVLVYDPSQHVTPSDADPYGRTPTEGGAESLLRLRRSELETPRGPGPVVVDDVGAKHALQVSAPEHQIQSRRSARAVRIQGAA